MNKTILLNNGVEMPVLGFGVDTLKGDIVIESVYTAIKAGYRMIDTASLYRNEKEVGIAIKKAIDEGIVKREDLFISSKAPYFFPGYDETIKGYEKSCEKLGLDYLDMYLLHHPYRQYFSWQKEIVSSYSALEKLYNDKKVRSIGVCNFSWPFFDVLFNCCEIIPQINQIEVHPEHQYIEAVTPCKEKNIHIVAWSALNKGHLIKNKTIINLSEKYNKTPAQIGLRWNIQKGNSVLVRSTKEDRIKSNYQIWDFEISHDDMRIIDAIEPDKLHHGHKSNSIPIAMMSCGEYWEKFEYQLNKPQAEKVVYKLFGFIPIIKKIKESNRITRWYFFNLPILKIDKK